MWLPGDTVDVEENENPPRHFVPVNGYEESIKVGVIDLMAPKPVEYGKVTQIKGGFAHNLESNVITYPLTTDKVPNEFTRQQAKLKAIQEKEATAPRRGRPAKK
jgi:hypothetical protein